MLSKAVFLLSISALANSLAIPSILPGMDKPEQVLAEADSGLVNSSDASRHHCSFNIAKIMGAIRPSLPVLLVSVGLLIVAFHIAIRRSGCMASRVKEIRERLARRRQEKRERRLKKALNRVARRLARVSAKKERVARFKCLLSRLAFWHRSPSVEQQDEEKAPFLREERRQNSSMADEIAQFRAAVSIVDDMVSDQESRSRQSKPATSERSETATSSAFVEYVLNDEDLLPTYEATQSVSDGSSANGGVYTPGTSSYTASADEAYDEKR